jgi:hypothetical protein
VDFYDKNIGGIYYILSYEANVPNQFRLLIPHIYKILNTIFPFVPAKAVYFSMIVVKTFFVLVLFYNILNEYFSNKNNNSYIAFALLLPAVWQFIILNGMFDFTDVANMFFILVGYYLVIKSFDKLLIIVFFLGTINHDSIGFCILMFLC